MLSSISISLLPWKAFLHGPVMTIMSPLLNSNGVGTVSLVNPPIK